MESKIHTETILPENEIILTESLSTITTTENAEDLISLEQHQQILQDSPLLLTEREHLDKSQLVEHLPNVNEKQKLQEKQTSSFNESPLVLDELQGEVVTPLAEQSHRKLAQLREIDDNLRQAGLDDVEMFGALKEVIENARTESKAGNVVPDNAAKVQALNMYFKLRRLYKPDQVTLIQNNMFGKVNDNQLL